MGEPVAAVLSLAEIQTAKLVACDLDADGDAQALPDPEATAGGLARGAVGVVVGQFIAVPIEDTLFRPLRKLYMIKQVSHV